MNDAAIATMRVATTAAQEYNHGHWAAGRHRRFGKFGFGGRHGMGGGDMNPDDMRAGRMLAQGDLRLVALALIAVAPRHGYEIIKLVEEKTADWYSPSPGIVYPTLTYLEEAGYVTASTEGSKKLYTITDEGRAYLGTQGDLVKVVLDRLAAIGERVSRWRRESRGERDQAGAICRRWSKPPSIICARPSPSGSRTIRIRNPGWWKSWPAPRRNYRRRNAPVSAASRRRPACAHARAGRPCRPAAPGCGAGMETCRRSGSGMAASAAPDCAVSC